MAKISRPILYLGLLTIGVAVWTVAQPPPSSNKPARSKTVRSSPKKQSIYTEQDYAAKFPAPEVTLARNAFKPVVARTSAAASGFFGNSGIPASFAGGNPNWVCTGTAEVDGVRLVLLENKASGDGVFLRQGDRWKNAVVSEVHPDGVVLVGPNGEVRSISVSSEEEEEALEALAPMQVPEGLTGPIGNGMSIRPQGGGGAPQLAPGGAVEMAPPTTIVSPAPVEAEPEVEVIDE